MNCVIYYLLHSTNFAVECNLLTFSSVLQNSNAYEFTKAFWIPVIPLLFVFIFNSNAKKFLQNICIVKRQANQKANALNRPCTTVIVCGGYTWSINILKSPQIFILFSLVVEDVAIMENKIKQCIYCDNQAEMVELLNSGLDPNYEGGWPIRLAARLGSYLVVKTLIQYGANPHLLSESGE